MSNSSYIDFDVISVNKEETILRSYSDENNQRVDVAGNPVWKIKIKPHNQGSEGGIMSILSPLDPEIESGGIARLTFL
jgi:hypothetical protein